MQNVLPSDEQMLHHRELGSDGGLQHEWVRRPFQETARIVCSDCNSGWMSRLEEAARRLLEGPLLGRAAEFGTPQRVVLARWAVKTALVFQASLATQPLASPGHFAPTRHGPTPSGSIAVWMGSNYRAREHSASAAFVQQPITIISTDDRIDPAQVPEASFWFLNFLAVGGVSFAIVGHGYANRIKFELDGPLSDALLPIWPHIVPAVSWPPAYMMDQQLIRLLGLPEAGISAIIGPPPEGK